MSYRHLSIIERSKLEILHQQGKSSRAIAKELGRHPPTICRELDRVATSQRYQAEQAQNAYEERLKASVSPGKWSDALADRGKEFACYASLETTHRLHVFFLIRIPLGNAAPTRMRMAYTRVPPQGYRFRSSRG